MNKLKKMNIYQRGILSLLRDSQQPLSTTEVARYNEVTWLTADKHLRLLLNQGIVVCMKKNGDRGSKQCQWKLTESERFLNNSIP